ncbi:MAG TPA: histidine phosphatase family protein [Myxococcota bacterium]|nr:histidine phosphatase family protein [Myxococcota bacterium]
MTARLLLVRHCQSSGQHPEAPLTDAGRAQAQALAERLAALPIDFAGSSPYLRARETLAPLAARAGLSLHLDERWAERRLSSEPIDHWREVVARSFVDLDFCVHGGESGRAVLARGRAALEAVFARGHALPVVASHGQLISLLLHYIDPRFGFAGWESLANPDVFELERGGAGALSFRRLALA